MDSLLLLAPFVLCFVLSSTALPTIFTTALATFALSLVLCKRNNVNYNSTSASTTTKAEATPEETRELPEEADCCSGDGEVVDSLSVEGDGGGGVSTAEDSISDDEGMIEIALPDWHSVNSNDRCGCRPEFSIDLLFRKHGLMELLSEINEEDNLIEIDIAMGSIKYSAVEINA